MAFEFIDPEAEKTITLEGFPGLTLKLRPIARGKWVALRNAAILIAERAQRRAIAQCQRENLAPDAAVSDGSRMTFAKFRENLDPTQATELAEVNAEITAWSVTSIEGAVLKGQPFEPERRQVEFEGGRVSILAPSAIRVISMQPGLVSSIANEAWKLNELGDAEKKA